jgi:hypothetical protein
MGSAIGIGWKPGEFFKKHLPAFLDIRKSLEYNACQIKLTMENFRRR